MASYYSIQLLQSSPSSSSSSLLLHSNPTLQFFLKFPITPLQSFTYTKKPHFHNLRIPINHKCTNSIYQETTESIEYETEAETEPAHDSSTDENEEQVVENGQASLPSLVRQRRRYRKQYPGEKQGITEEMRFVAMKLRNDNTISKISEDDGLSDDDKSMETWEPSLEGFLKYLVDNQLVFTAIERIVDQSTDVSFVYFRKTGLERSDGLSQDLEWFRQQGNVIPEPSKPGITYVQYLEELVEKSPKSFLCHFYNIYFSHIAGGQVIAKQVSERILEGREMEFYTWDGDAEDKLKSVRENLNALSEHWSRDEKNKCLREATKAFRFLGQIVRLIIIGS